ncbi:hypothetical protein BC828DRAFT_396128 [Blastocladiella britannica]|nr:hypothetical protein BC828DRAFT_396128 [Blastocladiella britannica]
MPADTRTLASVALVFPGSRALPPDTVLIPLAPSPSSTNSGAHNHHMHLAVHFPPSYPTSAPLLRLTPAPVVHPLVDPTDGTTVRWDALWTPSTLPAEYVRGVVAYLAAHPPIARSVSVSTPARASMVFTSPPVSLGMAAPPSLTSSSSGASRTVSPPVVPPSPVRRMAAMAAAATASPPINDATLAAHTAATEAANALRDVSALARAIVLAHGSGVGAAVVDAPDSTRPAIVAEFPAVQAGTAARASLLVLNSAHAADLIRNREALGAAVSVLDREAARVEAARVRYRDAITRWDVLRGDARYNAQGAGRRAADAAAQKEEVQAEEAAAAVMAGGSLEEVEAALRRYRVSRKAWHARMVRVEALGRSI